MTNAEIVIQLPEGTWVKDVSEKYPEATFHILSVVSDEESGVGTLKLKGESVSEMVEGIKESNTVESSELLYKDEDIGEAILQFETEAPLLHLAATESNVPINMPIKINDCEVVMELTAPHSCISDFVGKLDEYNLEFEVNHVKEIETENVLTEKQRRLIETGIEKGYYGTPRECSLTKLADEMDMAKSTCSDMLHRAESKIVKEFMNVR